MTQRLFENNWHPGNGETNSNFPPATWSSSSWQLDYPNDSLKDEQVFWQV